MATSGSDMELGFEALDEGMEPEDSGRLVLLMHTFCPRPLLVSACDGPVPAAGSQWATWKREKVISGSMPVCKGAAFASLTLI